MRLDDFDYSLPPELIAQQPPARRGGSRLMVLDRQRGSWVHTEFSRLRDWLRPGDLLVRNDTRVIPARVRGRRESGGEIEVLLVRREVDGGEGEVWTCLARPGRRLRVGGRIFLRGGIEGSWLDEPAEGGLRRVRFFSPRPVLEILDEVGEVPLPPYIDRLATEEDRTAYQTVYAKAPGAVAAPTAGLHFTSQLLEGIAEAGVEIHNLTLHVGPATFLPVREEVVERHRLGAEEVHLPLETLRAVRRAKTEGRRVVAVGTTTVRALEGALAEGSDRAASESVSVFIFPGYRFRIVDALVTNFHLPRSTLLLLVAAFAGRDLVLRAYQEAVAERYRFYSYGDAMFIV